MADVILESTLTCPHCGHQRKEVMPTDACQWFYECVSCHTLLRPKPGDCCVFCSYGDVPCPPIQLDQDCCSSSQKGSVMKTLEIFDPAMCCSTGVCGVEVDPVLAQFAADLKWVEENGIKVSRHNLGQEPAAFAANPAVVKEMEAGMDRLPVILIDGQVMSTGLYPSRTQLAQKLGLKVGAGEMKCPEAGTAPAQSCCSPKSGCC